MHSKNNESNRCVDAIARWSPTVAQTTFTWKHRRILKFPQHFNESIEYLVDKVCSWGVSIYNYALRLLPCFGENFGEKNDYIFGLYRLLFCLVRVAFVECARVMSYIYQIIFIRSYDKKTWEWVRGELVNLILCKRSLLLLFSLNINLFLER